MATSLTDTRLRHLAGSLLATAEPGDPPIAFGVSWASGEVELHFRDLVAGDPAAELRGFRAPESWWAFGVVAHVRTRCLDTGAVLAEHQPFVHLVARSGEQVTVLDSGGVDPLPVCSAGGPHGRLSDACARVLALPTPPPPADSGLLLATLWLDAVARRAQAEPGSPPFWPDVVALLPLSTSVAHGDPAESGDVVSALGPVFAHTWPWGRLRSSCAAGMGPLGAIDATIAAWADEGTFARLALEPFPDLPDLVALLDALLAPPVARRIHETLTAWGLSRWPDPDGLGGGAGHGTVVRPHHSAVGDTMGPHLGTFAPGADRNRLGG
ncbi:hypothetical protein [Rhabdothermincola sp.]|uniref:hypothetical protein n=1 Tax=Rhabdothermincola sp. TaxID=2820405 RepID=UPI002FE40739